MFLDLAEMRLKLEEARKHVQWAVDEMGQDEGVDRPNPPSLAHAFCKDALFYLECLELDVEYVERSLTRISY